MLIDLGDEERARIEKSESRLLRQLLDDDWRPLSAYRYDRRYVYAATVNYMLRSNCVIARGGKYESSTWWTPDNKETPVLGFAGLSVTHWKPLPEGVDAFDPLSHWQELTDHAWLDPMLRRHVEREEYEPAPPTMRLIPSARELLAAMRAGAVLRERGREWASFSLTRRPGCAPEKITLRPLRPLIEASFVVFDGKLPPRKDQWYNVEWKITGAGHAWLAANIR